MSTLLFGADYRIKGRGPDPSILVTVTELGSGSLVFDEDASYWDALLPRRTTVNYTNAASIAAIDDLGNTCPIVTFDAEWPPDNLGGVYPGISGHGALTVRSPVYGDQQIARNWLGSTAYAYSSAGTFKPRSLAAHVMSNVNSMVAGKTAGATTWAVYTSNNYSTTAPNVVRNSNLFCAGYSLTGMPVADSASVGSPNGRPPCLITPRHAVSCSHWVAGVGTSLVFLGTDGNYYTRTVTGSRGLGTVGSTNTDITVYSLSSDLPSVVKPFKLLPADWLSYLRIGGGDTYPVGGALELFRFLGVGRSPHENDRMFLNAYNGTTISTTGVMTYTYLPGDPLVSWFHQIIGGDSGSPEFLPINGDLVLIFTHYTSGYSTMLSSYLSQIQAAMDTLAPGYTPSFVDLSMFETYHVR